MKQDAPGRGKSESNERFCQRYGPWAVVTGASSGVGEAFAHALAARGVRSLLVARREDELARVATEVGERYGYECEVLALDLADPEFVDRLTEACASKDVGLVVGNAAYNPAGAFRDMSREVLLRMLDVNDRANLLLAEAFLPKLQERGRGGFLMVASTEAFTGTPYSACYSASKAFVLSLGEALWGEMLGTDVDVLVLAPSATDTPLLASRDLGDFKVKAMAPRDVADIGLDHLGAGPYVVPGASNKWTVRILQRLPRRWVVRMMAGVMRRMVKSPAA